MSEVTAAGAIYRLPPFVLGPTTLLAADLSDCLDWGLKAHKIPDRWKSGGGAGVVVGVADTGRPRHSDLEGAVQASHNFSTSHTDDDLLGHGTHVCGTIGARRNGRGVVGVAPECQLVTAKVLGDDASGDVLSVARGLSWLAEQGCHIINMSLGGAFDETIAKVVKELVDAGIFVICAVGNEGHVDGRDTVNYPARLPYTVAVTSYNKSGNISHFASRGVDVDIALPGEDILSCWPTDAYRRISGTSMAAPFASGLVALLLSASQEWPPEQRIKNNAELLALIQQITIDRGETGPDREWGWGVLDIDRLIRPLQAAEAVATAAAAAVVAQTQPLLEMPAGLSAETITHAGRTGLFITRD
jgi:minor extracellular protease Epr